MVGFLSAVTGAGDAVVHPGEPGKERSADQKHGRTVQTHPGTAQADTHNSHN